MPSIEQQREYKRRYKALHPERVREQARRHNRCSYGLHKEKRDAAIRQYRIDNKEKCAATTRRWKAKNIEHVRAYAREYWYRNRAQALYRAIKAKATREGVAFDLDKEWFEQRLATTCALSDLPFVLESDRKRRTAYSPSVDRIVAGGGYTKANCRMVLWCINQALHTYGEECLLEVFRAILGRRGELPRVLKVAAWK